MSITGNLYNWLGKKIDKADIQTIYSTAEKEYAFKKLAFEIAISYIASAITKCKFKVYKNGIETTEEDYYKLNIQPNPNQTATRFWEQTITRLYKKGESLIINKDSCLYSAESFHKKKKLFKENIYENIVIDNECWDKKYKENQVFHFELENNLNKLLNETYEKYAEIMAYAIKSYKRTNSEKYKLILESMKAGDKEFQEEFENVIKKQLETFIKNDDAVYPQFEGYDLQKMSSSEKRKDSSDFIGLRKDTFEMVASAIKMPVKMIYGDMNNVEEVINQFLTFTIDPLAKNISEELTRKIIGLNDWKQGYYIQIDTTSINHVDLLNVVEKVDKLIASGTANIDEVRSRVGLSALNTDFSKQFWITKNYDTVENLLKTLKGGEKNE